MLNNSVFVVGRIPQWPQDSLPLVYVHCPSPFSAGRTCEYNEIVILLIRLRYMAKVLEQLF